MPDEQGRAQFVLHDHRRPRVHYDLRLEKDGVLRSWAVPKGLPTTARQDRLAIAVGNHDLDHLAYEDEHTSVADTGWWEEERRSDRELVLVLHGRNGPRRYALIHTGAGPSGRGGREQWLLHLTKDQPPPP